MLSHYLDNYQEISPAGLFDVDLSLAKDAQVKGDGFMLEQLMDKLLSNAKDFNNGKKPIQVKVSEQNNLVEIRVLNTGPALPKGYEKQIFDGMMSIREANSDDQAHLGLGLFIVKLIAGIPPRQCGSQQSFGRVR